MKSKGFTLAEVLITIMLLGIIAILVMPALLTNIQKSKAGPAFMRAVSVLDNANSLMFVNQEIYNFSETCYGEDPENAVGYVTSCFEPFIRETLGAAQDQNTVTYQPFHGGEEGVLDLTGGYATKNGFTYYFDSANEDENGISVAIDINGDTPPNIIGKDLFYAYISYGQNGKVIPRGSRIDPTEPEAWVGKCDASAVTDEQYCAGSISDNGGKVIYPW